MEKETRQSHRLTVKERTGHWKHFLRFFCLVGIFLFFACTGDKNDPVQADNTTPEKGSLTRAVIHNDLATVRALLARGGDINEDLSADNDNNEITPLLAAIALNHQQIALLLVNWGAALHPSFAGYSSLDFARHIYGSESEITRALIHTDLKERK